MHRQGHSKALIACNTFTFLKFTVLVRYLAKIKSINSLLCILVEVQHLKCAYSICVSRRTQEYMTVMPLGNPQHSTGSRRTKMHFIMWYA